MRAFNFSAGPSTLPLEVLNEAAQQMLEWNGAQMGVMEMSHRGEAFSEILQQTLSDLAQLMALPKNYRLFFMQGGATGQNAAIPLNLLKGFEQADYLVTGHWSSKTFQEAKRYCQANLLASTEQNGFTSLPPLSAWQTSPGSAYLHFCYNETVHGVEIFDLPDGQSQVPWVVDISSNILSRPIDVSRFGVLYGGAQKNIGIAGITVVVVREDLLDRALSICPSILNWRQMSEHDSMLNTPPTYAIYIAGLVFKWLKQQGGVAVIEQRNIEKANLLYQTIDESDFYNNPVERSARSRMNVRFSLQDERLNQAFIDGAKAQGLLQIKGHKAVGGMRASIYNAMPIEGVRKLVDFMKAFEKERA